MDGRQWIARLRLIASLLAAIAFLAPPNAAARPLTAGGECDEGSTPRLVITGSNPSSSGIRLTLTAQTSNDGSAHGNVIYEDGPNQIVSLELHRVFLRDEGHAGHGVDGDQPEGVMAALRGAGRLASGELVRAHIDIQDRGDEPYTDRFRIRWRLYHDEHAAAGMEEGGECSGEWLYNSGWQTAHHIKIHQR